MVSLSISQILRGFFFPLIVLLLLHLDVYAQIDTEFWFAAPSVTDDHGDRPIVLRFATFDAPANISISQPANPRFTVMKISMEAGQSRTVGLTGRIHLVENQPTSQVLDKGLHIISDAPITAYYEVNNDVNPDIFSLKGRNALGKEFMIPAQNFWSNADWYAPPANSTIDIVATEPQTTIQITAPVRTRQHAAGETFTIVLDRGQTYSLAAFDHHVSNQLTGTRVVADKLIAITIKDDSNNFSPCLDLGGDQLVPLDVLGNEYIVVKGFLQGGDRVFVLATEDGTRLSLNGQELNLNLNSGDMHSFNLRTESAHIKSNHPIYVVHGTGFGCETGQAVLPKLECTGSNQVNFTRSTIENFGIILICKAGNEDGFTLNGSNDLLNADVFSTVPGTDDIWVATRLDLTGISLGGSAFTVVNTKGSFHLGTINGGERTGCRYGYFSDFKTLKILTDASKVCLGAELVLNASGSDHYEWFGDTAVEGMTEASIKVYPEVNTLYGVIGSNGGDGCLDTALLNIEVFEWPKPEIEVVNACVHQPVSIYYQGDEELERIEWIVGNDTVVTGWQEPFEFKSNQVGALEVFLSAINPAGCVVDTSYQINIRGLELKMDTVFSITRGESKAIDPMILQGGLSGVESNWSPSQGLSCDDCLSPIFNPQVETEYQLILTDSMGCRYTYQLLAYVDAPIYIPNAFSPNGDERNDRFEIFAEDVDFDQLLIFDRWGELLYQSDQVASGWDGMVNGKPVVPGTYLYQITGKHINSQNHFSHTGTVHIIR